MKSNITTLAALGVLLIAANLYAEPSETDAQALLKDVANAYRNLTSFSATMQTTQGSGGTARTVTTKITLQKPDRLSAEIVMDNDMRHVVADGTAVWSDSSREKTQYTKETADKFETVVATLGRNGGVGVGLLPILLTSTHAETQIIPGKPVSVNQRADIELDGQKCDVVAAIVGVGDRASRYEFAFGKQDHLLRRLTIGPATEGVKPKAVETYSDVTVSPVLNETTFKYTPAADAVAVSPPKESDRFDPRLKVGAAPLPIIGMDLAGKTASLDQYKGKVLLVDFWATWCGPCVAELPNVIAAYSKYHEQGFEILGVSLDQADARPKLEKFIADNKMSWRQIYDGKYWEAENAKAWGIHAIPFTLLIGIDGKIAAVGARGDALAPAIEAALKKQ